MNAKTVTASVVLLLLSLGLCSCGGELEIKQDYGFRVEYLPVPKKLSYGEVAEIRCQIVREGYFEGTRYRVRFFQPDGRGELRLDDGTMFLPNDYYELPSDDFRLYYTSKSSEQQSIDLYFFDSFEKSFSISFSFNADTSEPLPTAIKFLSDEGK